MLHFNNLADCFIQSDKQIARAESTVEAQGSEVHIQTVFRGSGSRESR